MRNTAMDTVALRLEYFSHSLCQTSGIDVFIEISW